MEESYSQLTERVGRRWCGIPKGSACDIVGGGGYECAYACTCYIRFRVCTRYDLPHGGYEVMRKRVGHNLIGVEVQEHREGGGLRGWERHVDGPAQPDLVEL